ncbi:adenine phosphoribosyltransferase [Haloferax sp. wsp5]|nr:adenine phosphoribosyltransferase [Haloferax sp. wsp5]
MDQLRQSLLDAPIIEKGDYEYFVHPISDGVPMLEPGLLREIVIKIIRKANLENVDKIVTPAAMGIHISTAVSLMTDIPLVVIRKRRVRARRRGVAAQQRATPRATCTSTTCRGRPVLVLDDVLSTGGTLAGLTGALEDIGADIRDIVVSSRRPTGRTSSTSRAPRQDAHQRDRRRRRGRYRRRARRRLPDTDTAAASEPRHFRPQPYATRA